MSSTHHSHIIDVNQADFQNAVVQRSHQIPVVVDFWAPWCGPCRMLGPILEQLAAEPNSNFVLAKVNADHNPQLSMQYGVRGIPAVKAFVNGRVVDEFVGAQPEPSVRQFIQRLTAAARNQMRPETGAKVKASEPAASLDQARQLLRQGRGCDAQNQLQRISAGTDGIAARKLLPLAQFLCQLSRGAIDGASDLYTMYKQAGGAIQRRDYSAALYNLLAILRQDARFHNGQADQVMSGLFELLGESDPLTRAYQQQLAAFARS